MHKSILLIMIASMLVMAGCGDDDSGGGTWIPRGNFCAEVSGTWSMLLEADNGPSGGLLSSIAELSRSDSCSVSGAMARGPLIEGFVTEDSLYFRYGEDGSAPGDQVSCALEIIDEFLMTGEFAGPDGYGTIAMHGPAPDCSGTVDLRISPGAAPVFSWKPECEVSLLVIEDANGGDQWLVGNENANDLESPLTYGDAPPGVYSSGAIPLVADRSYKAIIYRWLGTEDAYLMVSHEVFTP